MSMVCPQCKGSFQQHLQCPTCSVRLLYQGSSREAEGDLAGPGGQWQHTPWGRILVGLLLAQGLYHGLRQLCTAGLLAVAEPTQDVWSTIFGLILLQGIQGVGLLAGGMLAGAGQRRGIILGAVVGVWNGVILIVLEQLHARSVLPGVGDPNALPLTSVTAYGQPLLLAAFGAVGGLIGSLIWRPLPTLNMPGPKADAKPSLKWSERKIDLFAGPVAWGRVLLGIGVTVSGAIWANVILDFVLKAAEGKLAISSRLQARLVTMEICALAVLLGSCLAGATTANGLKQGLFVGLGATAVLVGMQLGRSNPALDQMAFTGLSNMLLALAGGWFGGQLFPPLLSPRRRKRFSTATGI